MAKKQKYRWIGLWPTAHAQAKALAEAANCPMVEVVAGLLQREFDRTMSTQKEEPALKQ